MRLVLAAVILASSASVTLAQDDPMEVQRCIWRCLEGASGADDPAYRMCVSQKCNGEQEDQQPSDKTTRSSPAPEPGTWTYGEHPVLGLSAHVETAGGGAIGLACAYQGTSATFSEVVALRATSELFRSDHLTYLFQGLGDAGSMNRPSRDGFSELKGTTCEVSLDAFRTGNEVVIVDGRIETTSMVGDQTQTTIADQANSVVVTSAAEAREKLNGRPLSLKGSAKAIARLIAQCPAVQRDIENECGI